MRLALGLLVVLAAVWAAVLLPSLVRSRVLSSPIDGVRSFEEAMGILAGTRSRRGNDASGRWVMVPRDVTAPPRRRARVIERRRRIFTRLLAFAGITLALGFMPALRWVWFINLAADAALSLYVWRLLRLKTADQPAPAFEPQPTIVLDDAEAPSIQTYRLDPEPSIAPAAGQNEAEPGWMTRTG